MLHHVRNLITGDHIVHWRSCCCCRRFSFLFGSGRSLSRGFGIAVLLHRSSPRCFLLFGRRRLTRCASVVQYVLCWKQYTDQMIAHQTESEINSLPLMKLLPWMAEYFFHKNFLSSWDIKIWFWISDALSQRAAFSWNQWLWLQTSYDRTRRRTSWRLYQYDFFDTPFEQFVLQFVAGFGRYFDVFRIGHLLLTGSHVDDTR